MTIAQLCVASEGVAHPAESGSLPSMAGTDLLQFDTTNLPRVILNAVFRAASIPELTPRARALLAALARTVDARRPFAAIFARRELLTGRAIQSPRTFYRSLNDLEAAGMVTRAAQMRYGQRGQFGRTYIHLTARAAAILGLTAEQANAAKPHSSVSPDATLAHGAIYKDQFPTTQKRQPGTLPTDLQRLRVLGFGDFLIFRLMREARELGKRLSDVVEATWQHLKAATRPISYLRALLRSTADFSYRIRAIAAEAEALHESEQERQRVDQTITRCAGLVFLDRSGSRRFDVASDGESVTVYEVAESSPRVAVSGWRAQFVTALHRKDIFEAKHAELEAFAAARRRATTPANSAGQGSDIPRALTPRGRDELSTIKALLRVW